MRSNFTRIGITALLMLGSVGCHGASAPVASDAKAAPEVQPKPVAVANCTPPEGPQPRPDYCSYPADIRDFIDMRDSCDHWRGEPWATDEEIRNESDPLNREIAITRKKQILEAIKESCTGTDKRLAALKATYAKDPSILDLLDEFEPDIEPND